MVPIRSTAKNPLHEEKCMVFASDGTGSSRHKSDIEAMMFGIPLP